jgi:hypothetical protein
VLHIQSGLKITICGRNEIQEIKNKIDMKRDKKNEREGIKQRAQK